MTNTELETRSAEVVKIYTAQQLQRAKRKAHAFARSDINRLFAKASKVLSTPKQA